MLGCLFVVRRKVAGICLAYRWPIGARGIFSVSGWMGCIVYVFRQGVGVYVMMVMLALGGFLSRDVVLSL